MVTLGGSSKWPTIIGESEIDRRSIFIYIIVTQRISVKISYFLTVFAVIFSSSSFAADGEDYAIKVAVHSSFLSASMSYCHAKYGITNAGQYNNCFEKAKGLGKKLDLDNATRVIQERCRISGGISKNLMPELMKIVVAMNMIFDSERL